MKSTAAGYPYKENDKLSEYLQTFVFCVDCLKEYRHIPVKHLMARWALTEDNRYQIIAEAESYVRRDIVDKEFFE